MVAAGGVLFFSFPRVYSAGFSGFYLALIVVLWLLVLRGLAMELRSHLDNPLWRTFWDKAFGVASLLLSLVLGVALGNVVRGVPLNGDGYFFIAWWTDLRPGPAPGILDWYTILMGLLGVAVLALHGANYLAMKTEGAIHDRAAWLASRAIWIALALSIVTVGVAPDVQPLFVRRYVEQPVGFVLPAASTILLLSTFYFRVRKQDVAAFLASSGFILAAIGSTAWGLYPRILIATTDPANSLTIENSATSPYGQQIGLAWFAVGAALAIAYATFVYRSFRGKTQLPAGGHGY